MSTENLKRLLVQLHQELTNAGALSDEDRKQLTRLHTDIHCLLEEEPPVSPEQSLIDRMNQLETRFAIKHPVTEAIFQEIMKELHMIGI